MPNDTSGPLSNFNLSNPEKAAQVGNQLIDEFEQVNDRFPNAAEERDKANGDIIVFCETANLDTESSPDCVIRERVQWVDEALRAWVEFVMKTGLDSHHDVQAVLDRIAVESAESQ
jgi:hypothetical protein